MHLLYAKHSSIQLIMNFIKDFKQKRNSIWIRWGSTYIFYKISPSLLSPCLELFHELSLHLEWVTDSWSWFIYIHMTWPLLTCLTSFQMTLTIIYYKAIPANLFSSDKSSCILNLLFLLIFLLLLSFRFKIKCHLLKRTLQMPQFQSHPRPFTWSYSHAAQSAYYKQVLYPFVYYLSFPT